jgi:DDE superfamily endonuclease/helix-turn-helix, Psq domain
MESNSLETRIILALQALKNDPSLSTRRAAIVYNVPRSTLRDRQSGRQSRRDTQPKSRKLTDSEESVIVQYILELDARAFPPRLSGVEDMANRLLMERNAGRVGTRWANNFIKRQPELKLRFSRGYDYQRAKCEDRTLVSGWFALLKNTIAKYGILDDDIYNFDETGFMMGVITTSMVVTRAERNGMAKLKQPGNREWVTVIQGVNALGWSLPPFVVVKGVYHLSSWREESRFPDDWRIHVSDNGWTTNEITMDWIRHFEKQTQPRKVGGFRLLILDGHESHHTPDFELYCKEKNIITLCMPAHSSHILQPLDVGCFSPLKKAYGKQIERLMRGGQTHVAKEDFFLAFCIAFPEAMTISNVQGGFRGTGIVPFNPEEVLEGLPWCIDTPTATNSRPGTAQSWHPKTPQNATEASSQSTFIKTRISQHQGSSPTPIIDAVNQFARGSVMIMHEVALLRSRITELEEVNERLSKRRRTKKTRLQKGGSLSIKEADDLMAVIEVDGQLRGEIHSSGSQSQGAISRVRHCSNCGEAGHNARTCQAVIETSSDNGSCNYN